MSPQSAPPFTEEEMRRRRSEGVPVTRFDDADDDRLTAAGLPAPKDDERAEHQRQLREAHRRGEGEDPPDEDPGRTHSRRNDRDDDAG